MKRLFILLLGFVFLAGPVLEPPLLLAQRSKGKTVRKRRLNGKFKPKQTQIETERVQEIQNALIHEGFLKGPASGKWDGPTEQAMSEFQRRNGFKVTGKPDAKSLQKLGL